jgi:hypothetical protein
MTTLSALAIIDSSLQFLLLDGTSSRADDFAYDARSAGLTVRAVRGGKMRTPAGLFDEFAAAFQFPWYFGQNWDAFIECMSDLDWLEPGLGYLVMIRDAAELLADESASLPIFAAAMARATIEFATPIERGAWWDRPAIPFHVLLVGNSDETNQMVAQWGAAGVETEWFNWTPRIDP